MTEAELLAEVTAAADERGLLWHHCDDSRRCSGPRGFLDLVLVGPDGKVMLAELKGEDGETSANQDAWIWRLHEGGTAYAVWHPSDWRSGMIQAALDRLK